MSLGEIFNEAPTTQRVCGCCGKSKDTSEFYKDGKDGHGAVRYRRDCKDCYKSARLYEQGGRNGKK